MPKSVKNVVIVGAGVVGTKLAGALQRKLPVDYRIVLITENEVGFFPPASLRSSIDPNWTEKCFAPLDKIFSTYSSHKLIKLTKVVSVNDDNVELDKADADLGKTIPYDFLIIATGSRYSVPARPAPGSTKDDVIDMLRNVQKSVAAATSVLIVGGGAVGVEFAGEVKTLYPNKPVTIATRQETVLHDVLPSVSSSITKQLKKAGVIVSSKAKVDTTDLTTGSIEKRTIELGNGETAEADFILLSTGNKPSTKFLPSTWVDDKGFVKTKHTMQVIGHERVFAVGDAAAINERKTLMNGTGHIAVVVSNIMSIIAKKPLTNLIGHAPGKDAIIVTLGPTGGAGQLFDHNFGPFVTKLIKGKGLFVGKFRSQLNV